MCIYQMLTLRPINSLLINPRVGYFKGTKKFCSTEDGVVVQKVTKTWNLIEALAEKDKITFLTALVDEKCADEWERFQDHGWGGGFWKHGYVTYYEAFQLFPIADSKWESLPDVFSQAAYEDLGSIDEVERWQSGGDSMLHWYDTIEIKGEAVVFSNEEYETFRADIETLPNVQGAGDAPSSVYEKDLFQYGRVEAKKILNSHFYRDPVKIHTITSKWTGNGYNLTEWCDGQRREDKPSREDLKKDWTLCVEKRLRY